MKKIIYFLSIVLMSSLMFSCAKEGCTDPDAENYNSSADKSDGSCTFQGRVVFWYNEATSDSLYYFGSDVLTYTVDGEVVGTQDINTYWTGAPDCEQSGSITVTKDLGSDKTKSFTYTIVDDLGDEIWGGNLEFTGNTCWGHELTW
jgi:hypothetical protein